MPSNNNNNNMTQPHSVVFEGWLKKKSGGIGSHRWNERYFLLRGNQLMYFGKKDDKEPRGIYVLEAGCSVSDIREEGKGKKKLHVFRILWPDSSIEQNLLDEEGNSIIQHNYASPAVSEIGIDDEQQQKLLMNSSSHSININNEEKKNDNIDDDLSTNISSTNTSSTVSNKSKYSGGSVAAMVVGGIVIGALTAGLGLLAGVVIIGASAAASTGAVAYQNQSSGKHKKLAPGGLLLGSDNINIVEEWKLYIETQIRYCERSFGNARWNRLFGSNYVNTYGTTPPPPSIKLQEVDQWTRNTNWKVVEIYRGLRIFEEDIPENQEYFKRRKRLNVVCRRGQLVIRSTPLDTFITTMTSPIEGPQGGIIKSIGVIETIDDHTDVINMRLRSIYLSPTWTAPRDFCLMRYWKVDPDGSYIICMDSINHPLCPKQKNYVRGELHCVYTIAPRKDYISFEHEVEECLATYILQVNPRGWIWDNFNYKQEFANQLLLQLLDIRDITDATRFMSVRVDAANKSLNNGLSEDILPYSAEAIALNPPCTLSSEMWAEPDSRTFIVRGKNYLHDRIKIQANEPIFRFIAADLFQLQKPTKNILSYPNNRVQLAYQQSQENTDSNEKAPFIFAVQIMLPGPPYYAFIAYFTPSNPNIFEEDTPFTKIAKPFFFGDDDNFRDHRFKLIPKIVDGNFVVRRAVGSTPAILGTKLKQYYFRGPNYFELDIDIASSSVAAAVVKLAIGYAKTLVVDMGLVLQGNSDEELPEEIFACMRVRKIDMTTAFYIEL